MIFGEKSVDGLRKMALRNLLSEALSDERAGICKVIGHTLAELGYIDDRSIVRRSVTR
jgi:hypothetical protein